MAKNQHFTVKYQNFLQGYALAIGFLIRAHGQDSIAMDAMREHGVTLDDLIKARCDAFDLDPIREVWRRK